MKLRDYLDASPRGTAKRLAEKLRVSPSFLSQMAAGTSAISTDRAVLIERETGGAVHRRDIYPNDWIEHWPELADREAA